MEDKATFDSSKMGTLLTSKDYDQVLLELQDPANFEFVRRNTLEIIPEIGSVLIGQTNSSAKAVDFCLEAFKILAHIGNAKEVLMGFLEQLEYLACDVRFHVLLFPIQEVLLRMPNKRGQSLEWVLDSIHGYVKLLPVPKSYNLEGRERLILDYDSDVMQIQNVIESIIDFCRPFIKEVSLLVPDQRHDERAKLQREILARFILKLFDTPLAMVDLSQQYTRTKSILRNVAELLVANMCELEPNFYRFYVFKYGASSKSKCKGDGRISDLAMATFSYLVHAEQVCRFCLPCIYSHRYTFEINLPLICYLLKQTHDCVIQKGLLLSDYLLQYLRKHDFDESVLDLDGYTSLSQCLIDVMVFCQTDEFRKLALTIFVKYVEIFNDAGRYKILLQLLNSNKHAGVLGLLIQLYKTNAVAALQHSPASQYFVGPNLEKMLRLILVLPDGVETDLLEDCEHILEALNLVRYLLLKDAPAENVTGVWNMVDFLENSYMKPLQTGLDLSKAHFELELKSEKENKTCENGNLHLPLSVTVEGTKLPLISHDHKLDVLQKSILGLELIQSVLSVVGDIITSKKPLRK